MKMAEALRNIGLSVLIPRFQNENVNTETILKLTYGNLIELGVTKSGDRIQLNEECRKLSQKSREENANTSTDGDESNNIDSNSVARTVANERTQLFRPYTSGHASRRRSNAREVHFRSSSIGSVCGGGGPEKKPKFWNANFVSLASMYAMKVPNSSEKEMLRKAGLGVRKIKLNLQDNEDEVFKKLCCGDIRTGDDEENLPVGHPKLADCGGFELVVCQRNSRQLTVLDCTLSTKDLRARIRGSQSKVCIRPIQKNLNLKPIVKDKTSQRTEKCFNCCKEFPVPSLRMHTLSCKPTMEFGFESSPCSKDDEIFNLDPFTTKSTGGR